MRTLLGVVACGGQSKRMGTDKGSLVQNGKAWAVLIAEKLKACGLELVISINQDQHENYKKLFPDTPLIVDQLEATGPLGGLLSVHNSFPEKDLLLMACDLIDMTERPIKELIETYHQRQGFEYYVYRQNGFTQPFCAIYTSKPLVKIAEKLNQQQLNNYSLHQKLESGNTLYLPVNEPESFNNYNKL
jgi:molybdenum cofactor guanylyltransferase